MKKVELNIIALANSQSSAGNFVLILEEKDGFRRLPIIIGSGEAQAIAIHLEQLQPDRPLTHDLYKNTLLALEATIAEVQITNLIENTFHAVLICKKADDTILQLDARPSDAVAIAIRFNCPIFTTTALMQQASTSVTNPNKVFMHQGKALTDYSLTELHQLLKQVLAEEDYKRASQIRDAIKEKEA